jgi:hypothetical protein
VTASQTVNLTSNERDIHAIGRFIEAQIAATWGAVLEQNAAKLADAYAKGGDMAYGTYLTLLFRPIHKRLKEAGLTAKPRFPGDFQISREWGRADETDQQRWMWSAVNSVTDGALGTIVTIVFHDHTQFRLPRAPRIIALAETGKRAVIAELSRRSTDFRDAREASIEIAEYLQSLQAQG